MTRHENQTIVRCKKIRRPRAPHPDNAEGQAGQESAEAEEGKEEVKEFGHENPHRDWLGIGVRAVCGAIFGAFIGLLLSMFQMGMQAGWMLILVPACIGAVVAVRYEG